MKKTYKIEVDCANCANLMGKRRTQNHRSADSNGKLHDAEDDS